MAKLKGGKGAFRMDLIDDDLSGRVTVANQGQIQITFGQGWFNDFFGTFQFDQFGRVSGGTLDSISYTLDGKLVYTLDGADFDAKVFFDLASQGRADEARVLVLAGNDQISGRGGDDFLIGYDGNDTIKGAGGGDHLEGDAGRDKLFGDDGGDTLVGGAGADQLTGGGGGDTFLFLGTGDSKLAVSGRDSILDFSHAEGDKIDVSAIDAKGGTVVDDAFTIVSAFSGRGGELTIEAVSGGYLVQGDVGGRAGADFAIFVASSTSPVATDFVL